MENQVLEKDLGNQRYIVCVDYDAIIDMDFESVKQRREYTARYESGELCFYSVHTLNKCECCGEYKEGDSLYGIDAESAEEALNHYIND